MNKDDLSQKFLTFAETECKGSSPLYEYLSLEISKDEELLKLCMNARDGQPIPNLLFGAVHYLLLKGKDHRLKDYYPSIVSNPKPHDESFEHFQDFFIVNIGMKLNLFLKQELFRRMKFEGVRIFILFLVLFTRRLKNRWHLLKLEQVLAYSFYGTNIHIHTEKMKHLEIKVQDLTLPQRLLEIILRPYVQHHHQFQQGLD